MMRRYALTLLALLLAVGTLALPVAAAVTEGQPNGAACGCVPLYQEQERTREFVPEVEEETVPQYRWFRQWSDKHVKGWKYKSETDSWVSDPGDWNPVPAHKNPPALNQVGQSGTFSYSNNPQQPQNSNGNYGLPSNRGDIQWAYLGGAQWFPSEDGWATEAEFVADPNNSAFNWTRESGPDRVVTSAVPGYWPPFGDDWSDVGEPFASEDDPSHGPTPAVADGVNRQTQVIATNGLDCTFGVKLPTKPAGVTYSIVANFNPFVDPPTYDEVSDLNDLDEGTQYTVFAVPAEGYTLVANGPWTLDDESGAAYINFTPSVENPCKVIAKVNATPPTTTTVPPTTTTTIPDVEEETVWVCRDGEVTEVDGSDVNEDENVYDTEDEAAADPDCVVVELPPTGNVALSCPAEGSGVVITLTNLDADAVGWPGGYVVAIIVNGEQVTQQTIEFPSNDGAAVINSGAVAEGDVVEVRLYALVDGEDVLIDSATLTVDCEEDIPPPPPEDPEDPKELPKTGMSDYTGIMTVLGFASLLGGAGVLRFTRKEDTLAA